MSDYDVIVVGGGPAGSTAARRAAQHGLSVLLLDKETFPRPKACGGGFMEKIREMLDFDIDEVSQRRVYGFRFFAPSGTMLDVTKQTDSGDMVMRSEFDHLLVRKAAEAGVEVRDGTKVVKAEQTESEVKVVTEKGESFSASYIVGADGINGVVAGSLGFYYGWRGKSAAVAVEIEAEVGKETVERICGVPDTTGGIAFNIYFGPVPYGYIWCFPKRSILSLGAGCRQDLAENLRGHFNKWLEKFKKEHDVELDVVSDMSARLPYSGAVKTTVKGRALLIGDAAGFVSPFSGEGVSGAVLSGILASSALKDAIENRDPRQLRGYERAWKEQINPDLKAGKALAKLMFKSEKNMETVLALGNKDPYIKEIMFKMIAGFESHATLRSKLVKRVMLKHPRAGLSLYT